MILLSPLILLNMAEMKKQKLRIWSDAEGIPCDLLNVGGVILKLIQSYTFRLQETEKL